MNLKSYFCVVLLGIMFCSLTLADAFDGQPDNERDDLGYYYIITGGKFPNGQTINGDNASGGTFRFLTDDPGWGGYTLDQWNKDDWFTDNASFALTMKNDGAVIYDNFNNDAGDYYDGTGTALSKDVHGLYRGYSMSNNYDWIYAGYFKLTEQTTIDQITGYFDETEGFDADNPLFNYRMNIWSNLEGDLLPAVNSFTGDVFSSDSSSGTFTWGYTGVDRVYGDDRGNAHDEIMYLTYTLDTPITLQAGEYWFSHDAVIVPLPAAFLLGILGLGTVGIKLRKH